jgi:predicted amidophosphoribosyltransferase
MVAGVVVGSAFVHEGAAAKLVHSLKYRRCLGSARLLADAMAPHLRPDARWLVPLPRAFSRRVKYGVDPAVELAAALGELTGTPLAFALGAPMWWRRRAGRPRDTRGEVAFRVRSDPGSHLVLIDDVLTTGATVASAVRGFGRGDISVLTATSAGTM